MQGPLPLQAEEQPWIDCCLRGHMPLLQVTTNLLYHCSVKSLGWLSSKAKEEWKIHKFDHEWWQILQCSWHSKLPLVAKVFIWRILIGGLPLGLALKCRGLVLRIKLECGLVCELTLRVNRHSNGQESPLSHHYVFQHL